MKQRALALIPFLALASPAAASEPVADFFSTSTGSISVYSDYSFRGISQSDKTPALQGSLTFGGATGPYIGAWGSNVDFNDGDEAQLEIDAYAGYKWQLGVTTLDVGGIYYAYPGADSDLKYDYAEAKIALSAPVSSATVTGSVFVSSDFFAASGPAVYSQLGVSAPVRDTGFSINASAGYQTIDDSTAYGVDDYADWLIGGSYEWEQFTFSVAYVDTDLSNGDCPDLCDARVIGSVVKAF